MKRSTTLVFILALFGGMASALPQSYLRGSSAACDSRRAYVDPTEEEIANFVYDPENEEAGPYFEGDIVGGIPEDLYDRNGIIGDGYRWPNNTVVYAIEGDFDEDELDLITQAHEQITKATDGCISFREKTDDVEGYAAIIKPDSSCTSQIGYQGDRQEIKLASGCFSKSWGSIAHEHIHALGFYHEQSREDRDKHVTIVWENIKEGHEHNFCKHESYAYKQRYDYDSIMHYNALEFSTDKKGNKQTIIPKKKNAKIGQRDHISKIDAKKIKKMYGCK